MEFPPNTKYYMSLSFPEKMGIIYHASLNFFKVKDVSKVDKRMILTRLLSDSDIEFLGELGESDVEGLGDPKEINDYMERSKANIEQKLRTVKIIGVSKGTLIVENCYIPRGTNVISFSNNACDEFSEHWYVATFYYHHSAPKTCMRTFHCPQNRFMMVLPRANESPYGPGYISMSTANIDAELQDPARQGDHVKRHKLITSGFRATDYSEDLKEREKKYIMATEPLKAQIEITDEILDKVKIDINQNQAIDATEYELHFKTATTLWEKLKAMTLGAGDHLIAEEWDHTILSDYHKLEHKYLTLHDGFPELPYMVRYYVGPGGSYEIGFNRHNLGLRGTEDCIFDEGIYRQNLDQTT